MKKYDYLLSEKDSDVVFAVIQGIDAIASLSNIDMINKVGQAVEDEFCYEEKVKVVHESLKEIGTTLFIDFRCLDEEGEEEIKEFELNITAIY